MTPELAARLRQLIAVGQVRWIRDSVTAAQATGSGRVCMYLTSGESILADAVVLATGYRQLAPLPTWLDDVVRGCGLPIDSRLRPQLDAALRWHPRVRVTGYLAESQIGPLARNLPGARLAGARIAASASD
jgi:hypothetical protein